MATLVREDAAAALEYARCQARHAAVVAAHDAVRVAVEAFNAELAGRGGGE